MAKKNSNKNYRLTVYDDETLKELMTLRLTKYNLITYGGIFMLIIMVITFFILIYSPLKIFLPMRSSTGIETEIIGNSLKIDSIEEKIRTEQKYLNQIKNILQGKIPVDTFKSNEIFEGNPTKSQELGFQASEIDSIVKIGIDKDENKEFSKIRTKNASANLKNLHFVVPLRGSISDEFNIKSGHLGIDITPGTDDAILAVLPGTIILSTWSLETGYIIGIQHDNNIVSFYKHNSVLLKKTGDRVTAGESIAIVGNSGEMTTGPHLHFELWINGVPMDPRNYITF